MANHSSFEADWHRYPLTSVHTDAKRWIQSCVMLGLASNTILAYARGIEGFLTFCQSRTIDVRRVSREVIAQYVQHLRTQPRTGRDNVICIDSGALLSNATLQQRLTAVRLFFDFLLEDELIKVNPVGRGRYTLSKHFGARAERALVQRFHKLPWIPSEEQWASLLKQGCEGTDPQSLHAGACV
jgi:integrase/recombinase XerD